jgi:hypothetical protein
MLRIFFVICCKIYFDILYFGAITIFINSVSVPPWTAAHVHLIPFWITFKVYDVPDTFSKNNAKHCHSITGMWWSKTLAYNITLHSNPPGFCSTRQRIPFVIGSTDGLH